MGLPLRRAAGGLCFRGCPVLPCVPESGVAVMWWRRWPGRVRGRGGVLNQGPGRQVLRCRQGRFNRADVHDQRWLVVVNPDLDAFLDDDSGVTGIGIEGFRPATYLKRYLADRARCNPPGDSPCPADHRVSPCTCLAGAWRCGDAVFTWRKLRSKEGPTIMRAVWAQSRRDNQWGASCAKGPPDGRRGPDAQQPPVQL